MSDLERKLTRCMAAVTVVRTAYILFFKKAASLPLSQNTYAILTLLALTITLLLIRMDVGAKLENANRYVQLCFSTFLIISSMIEAKAEDKDEEEWNGESFFSFRGGRGLVLGLSPAWVVKNLLMALRIRLQVLALKLYKATRFLWLDPRERGAFNEDKYMKLFLYSALIITFILFLSGAFVVNKGAETVAMVKVLEELRKLSPLDVVLYWTPIIILLLLRDRTHTSPKS